MTRPVATNSPGFQSSQRSGCQVIVYRQGLDVFARSTGIGAATAGPYTLDGINERSDRPCLISAQTQKAMGAAGSFSLTCKTPLDLDLRDEIMDDDWIDILMTLGPTKYHIIRGLVDDVRRVNSVAGSGSTTRVWTISGRDFQKIYEQTPIFFQKFNGENLLGAAAFRVVKLENIGGNISDTVKMFLQGFLKKIGKLGRANIAIPPGMPNMGASFVESVKFDDDDYTNIPPRKSISPSLMMPDGMAWDLAKEWSEPTFCELFTELYPKGDVTDNSDPDTTQMRCVLRDKPFPLVDPSIGLPIGLASKWFSLPRFSVPRQYVHTDNTGRSTFERLNAFYATPQIVSELMKSTMMQLTAPLWNPRDMFLHGMRRFDVTSRYRSVGVDDNMILLMSSKMRSIARDFYCMNPYLLSGTISFGCGQPALRIGCRLHIPGNNSEDDDETYYIEGVSHTWSVQQGMRTTATVTRGWKGTESSLISAMNDVVAEYEVGKAKVV